MIGKPNGCVDFQRRTSLQFFADENLRSNSGLTSTPRRLHKPHVGEGLHPTGPAPPTGSTPQDWPRPRLHPSGLAPPNAPPLRTGLAHGSTPQGRPRPRAPPHRTGPAHGLHPSGPASLQTPVARRSLSPVFRSTSCELAFPTP